MQSFLLLIKRYDFLHTRDWYIDPIHEREWVPYQRMICVTLRSEEEALTKIEGEWGPVWKLDREIAASDKLYIHPVDKTPQKCYRAHVSGLDLFKDLSAVESFYRAYLRVTDVQWFKVSREAWEIMDGSAWIQAVEAVITDPNLDFQPNGDSGEMSRIQFTVARGEKMNFLQQAPKCREVLSKYLRDSLHLPEEVITHLL